MVATPIGNLSDISKRVTEVLSSVDFVLAEDTRRSRKILSNLGFNKPIFSFHQHSGENKIKKIINLLREGKNVAFLTDAGTPNISDPGANLVRAIIENFGDKAKIIPLPGPSALAAAISIADFPMNKFLFLGFPPTKKKRKKFFEETIRANYPVVLYESSHRIKKTLMEIKEVADKEKIILYLIVCRELTKKFETIYRGKIEEIIKKIEGKETKGEFTIIIKKENKEKK